MKFDTKKIEQIIEYDFKDKQLLITAFTHSSYAFDNDLPSYERLEFLGDSVLGFIAADLLYDKKLKSEGKLSKAHDRIVCNDILSKICDELGLTKFIMFSKKNTDFVVSQNMKADIVEALIGAIYKDTGIKPATKFVAKVLTKDKDVFNKNIKTDTDFKTQLQEFLQAKGYRSSNWTYQSQQLSENPPSFKVDFFIDGKLICSGSGKKIKDAEQKASKKAISILKNKS
ncbi:MAG: ribonuclease III [Firmicutes bacterium]|nr:ribonuclease III [Bacillota bacterium]